jgi:hypothetical protein
VAATTLYVLLWKPLSVRLADPQTLPMLARLLYLCLCLPSPAGATTPTPRKPKICAAGFVMFESPEWRNTRELEPMVVSLCNS